MFSISKNKVPLDLEKYERIHVRREPTTQGPHLASLIASPPEGSVKMKITPELAGVMLQRNTGNRRLDERRVALYARQMTAGDWPYTRVPVIFSSSGTLIDGQHRLSAVVASGVTITSDVAFGAPDEAFAYIDNGKPRTAGDVFGINGVTDSKPRAAIAKFVYEYEQGYAIKGSQGVTNAELFEFYDANRERIDMGLPIRRKFMKKRIAAPALMAGLYVVCASKCKRDADEFFAVAADGFGAEKKTDPAFVLHNLLVDAATSGAAFPSAATAWLTLEAWNRKRAGLSGRGMKYAPDAKPNRAR